MKTIRSMPVITKFDEVRRIQKEKGQMVRSRSMSHQPEEKMRHLIRAVPFMAFAGLGSELIGFTRSYSRQALSRATSQPPSPTRSHETSSLLPHFIQPSYTISLLLAVFTCVLSSFQVGFNSGILNVPEAVIRYDLGLSETEWSIIISIFCIGGLVGSILGGRLADTIGRKNLLVSTNVLYITGSLSQSLADSSLPLIAGRFIIGLACGISTVIVPLYLGEIAPANLRGSLGTMNQFAIVVGILIANLLGKPLGGETQWRYLLGLVLIPSLLQLVLAALLLESPLWLVCQHNTKAVALAEEVLTKLRGHEDIEFELELLQATKEESMRQNTSFFKLISGPGSKQVRRSLVIGLTLQLAQQLSGINCVFYYSTAFFANAHVSSPWLGSVLASSINFLATALAIPLMDRCGRRVLLMWSCIGMMLSCFALTAALYGMSLYESVWLSTSAVFGVLTYVTFFEIGLGPIPWLIGAEIYPNQIRAGGMSLSSITNWTANFIVSLSFPHLDNILTPYTFLPFSGCLLLSFFFVWLYVPETRGKSLEEIQEALGANGSMTSMTGYEGGDDDAVMRDEEKSEGGTDVGLIDDLDDNNMLGGYSVSYGTGDDSDYIESPTVITPTLAGVSRNYGAFQAGGKLPGQREGAHSR